MPGGKLMADAYIVGAVRTATGKKKGRLSAIHPVDMGAIVVDELVDRTGIPLDAVDDVIFGVVMQIGQNTRQNVRRVDRSAAIHARMQVLVRPGDLQFQLGQSAQGRGDRRGLRIEHPGIAD